MQLKDVLKWILVDATAQDLTTIINIVDVRSDELAPEPEPEQPTLFDAPPRRRRQQRTASGALKVKKTGFGRKTRRTRRARARRVYEPEPGSDLAKVWTFVRQAHKDVRAADVAEACDMTIGQASKSLSVLYGKKSTVVREKLADGRKGLKYTYRYVGAKKLPNGEAHPST